MALTSTPSTVVALFDTTDEAQRAVRALSDMGLQRDDISLVAHDREGRYGSSFGGDTERTTDGTTVGENVAGGALFGGLGGLLIGLGALAIPGIGPVIAAGPLATTLAGAAIGAAGGGVIGALKDAGVPDADTDIYAEGIRRGGTLVSVHADADRAEQVARVLDQYGAVDIDERGNQYRSSGWSRFDDSADPYSSDAGVAPSRSERTLTDGQRVSRVYNRGGMGGLGTNFDADYRTHHSSTYGSGSSYESYAPAYQYGSELGSNPSHRGRSWDDVEDTARTDYLRNNPNSAWDQTKGAVRYGWERMTGQRGEDPTGVTHGTREMSRDLDNEWRSHYSSSYGTSGRSYDEYRPAYDYGSRMASDTRYSGRSWDDVEDTMRTDYLRNNPTSTWDNVKGAVRYGWEKVSGKRA